MPPPRRMTSIGVAVGVGLCGQAERAAAEVEGAERGEARQWTAAEAAVVDQVAVVVGNVVVAVDVAVDVAAHGSISRNGPRWARWTEARPRG